MAALAKMDFIVASTLSCLEAGDEDAGDGRRGAREDDEVDTRMSAEPRPQTLIDVAHDRVPKCVYSGCSLHGSPRLTHKRIIAKTREIIQ
jgi:hypothetical protein